MTLDLEKRKGKVGSSDIGAICGLNPYRSKLQVWAEMMGRVPPIEENDAIWLGCQQEDIVAKLFLRKNPNCSIRKDGETITSELYPFACATPDYRFISQAEEGILEIKTTSEHSRPFWFDGPPDHVSCQVQWQMGFANVKIGKIAVLIGGRELVVHDMEFQKEIFEQLLLAAKSFIENNIEKDVAPSAASEDKELLKILYPQNEEEKIIDQDSRLGEIIEEYQQTKTILTADKAAVDSMEKHLKSLENLMIQKMEGASLAKFKNFHLINKVYNNKGHTTQPFQYTRFFLKEQRENER